MCGFFGSINLDNKIIEQRFFERILSLLDHRGPDDKNTKSLGNAQVGNNRLSIIGINALKSSLPISDERFLLAYNGEIYNYKELNKLLIKERIEIEGKSDSETLFLLLKNFGIKKTLSLLDGMYAFVLFDKEKQKVFMVRDRIGERFLYYSLNENKFLFSSEIKTIAKSGLINISPNIEDIKDYLITSTINGSKTFFKNIFEIEPGTLVTFDIKNKKFITEDYWEIENTFSSQKPSDVKEGLYKELSEASISRSESDVPICILYSGGLDSNILLDLFCSNNKNKKIDLFFADNYTKNLSELDSVNKGHQFFLKKYTNNELVLNTNKVSLEQYLAEIEKLAWYYDEPISFVNALLLDQLCLKMKNKGFKVSTSGEGSDELFYGYERFIRTQKEFCNIKDNISIDKKVGLLYYGGGKHSLSLVDTLTENKNISDEKDSNAWNWIKKNINKDFEQLQLIYSQKYRLQILLKRQDRTGMKNSIEIRTPYLAPSLVNYVNSLSMSFKNNNSDTKYILRQIFNKKVHQKIIKQKKNGFPSDMLNWINGKSVEKNVTQLLKNTNSLSQNYLNGKTVQDIISMHYNKKKDLSTLIWMLYSLELWHKAYF